MNWDDFSRRYNCLLYEYMYGSSCLSVKLPRSHSTVIQTGKRRLNWLGLGCLILCFYKDISSLVSTCQCLNIETFFPYLCISLTELHGLGTRNFSVSPRHKGICSVARLPAGLSHQRSIHTSTYRRGWPLTGINMRVYREDWPIHCFKSL